MQTAIAILASVFIYALILSLVSKKTVHKEIVKNRVENLEKQKKELNFTILSIEIIEKNCYIIVE